jgi:hypothetical protein
MGRVEIHGLYFCLPKKARGENFPQTVSNREKNTGYNRRETTLCDLQLFIFLSPQTERAMRHEHDHNVKVELDTEKLETKLSKVKTHFRENKKVYLAGAGGAAFAGITCLIMRRVPLQSINRDTVVIAGRDAVVARKKIVMKNVSYISSDRQGPPSWVVRCKETNDIFSSQRSAALEMGLSPAQLSQHLNGTRHSDVGGYTFERICMAA